MRYFVTRYDTQSSYHRVLSAEDIRPEVEIQLLIQQQLLQHQVLLQYLENILEAKDGDCSASSQDIQTQITQLMGTSRRSLLEYLQQQQLQREGSPEEVTPPQEMVGITCLLSTYQLRYLLYS